MNDQEKVRNCDEKKIEEVIPNQKYINKTGRVEYVQSKTDYV